MRTSSGASLSGGKAAKKCFIEVAIALMCPAVPLMDCAIIRPRVSKIPQARSWLSRTIVLNAVRISASCCSLATDRRRFQTTSKVTRSIALPSITKLHYNIKIFVYSSATSRAYDQGRLAFLHNCRPSKLQPRFESVSIVHRSLDESARLGKIGAARPFSSIPLVGSIPGQLQIHFGSGSARYYAPVDDLQCHIGSLASVEAAIRFFEFRSDLRHMLLTQNSTWKSHRNLMTLANIAHIGGSLIANFFCRQARALQYLPSLLRHHIQQLIGKTPILLIQATVSTAHEVKSERRRQQSEGRSDAGTKRRD